MINPWSGHFTASLPAMNNKHRLRQLRRFIGAKSLSAINSLDVGAPNYISQQMEVRDNTRGDLNKAVNAPRSDYSLVLCLEVLNHVQQDLTLLNGIYERMTVGGKLYLSTPKLGMIALAHGKGNYKELKARNVIKLLEYCGFKVLMVKTFRSYPFRFVFMGFLQPLRWFRPFEGDTIKHPGAPKAKWYFFGLRPPLRWLLHKYILIEAEKV